MGPSLKGLYKWGLHPRERGNVPQNMEVEVFGHTLSNPIGTSAGIDKHAEIPDPLFALGPSIIEIGGATPHPQDGNPKPRVFRLPSQKALINRYGLNSLGADDVAMRLRQRVREYAYANGFGIDEVAEQRVLDGEAGVPGGSLTRGCLMAVQVAKNKFTPDGDIEAVKADYVYCVEALARYADIIVVNVSSPNTPGLRGLQSVEPLTNILTGVVEAAKKAKKRVKPAVMVKVSPDEDSEQQVRGICEAVWESEVDGVIVGNTTKRRHDLLPADYNLPAREAALLLEEGGYSGPRLFERTVALTRRYRELLDEAMEPTPKESPSTKAKDEESRENSNQDVSTRIQKTIERDTKNLKPDTPEANAESKSQPLIQIPPRNNPFSPAEPSTSPSSTPAFSADTHINQLPPTTASDPSKEPPKRKVIFATGGICSGKQALEVLEAGASVAQVYTALVYGGVGTIARMKDEMREEMQRRTG
ncbi:Dihydroorotate dehydrogenase (quinone), mitochondrial [Imshaugia aleurites]|uniref:Dihydroorotate dehydrogenase (quinone), mitochondrial n=1 Tax=Imshaugia aleurites TaxID=172621 RepID=A0A8H3G5J9_9LECA|nr:Dihydroorotate dehydrogenase (quinone), mitochondrial [Imshaugia aleurites]